MVSRGWKSYILMSEYYYRPHYDRLGIASVTVIGLRITSMNGDHDVTCLNCRPTATSWRSGCGFEIRGIRRFSFGRIHFVREIEGLQL